MPSKLTHCALHTGIRPRRPVSCFGVRASADTGISCSELGSAWVLTGPFANLISEEVQQAHRSQLPRLLEAGSMAQTCRPAPSSTSSPQLSHNFFVSALMAAG